MGSFPTARRRDVTDLARRNRFDRHVPEDCGHEHRHLARPDPATLRPDPWPSCRARRLPAAWARAPPGRHLRRDRRGQHPGLRRAVRAPALVRVGGGRECDRAGRDRDWQHGREPPPHVLDSRPRRHGARPRSRPRCARRGARDHLDVARVAEHRRAGRASCDRGRDPRGRERGRHARPFPAPPARPRPASSARSRGRPTRSRHGRPHARKDRSMTAIPRTIPTWRPRPLVGLRAIARGRTDEPAWVRVAFVGLIALAALLYLWNLSVSGYANTYYSSAALAAGQSWSAFFFGSFDAANFITVDKPPAAIWLMGLSVRVFGLSSWSVLLPEALAGVATVGILFAAVRRSFGPVAAVIAGLVMALTPAAVLIFRFNNPDALLTLLLVASAWALLRAIEHGGLRWVTLAAACVGFAFLTKYLQAYLVLPGFALVYLVAANASFRRRIAGLGVAVVAVLLASGWWVAIVALIPAASRPFIGGSTTGSVLDLIFGYDGLGRIFGAAAGGTGNSTPFGGTAGLLRLFNDAWFGEIAWFIPPALASLGLGLWLRRRAGRTDRALAGYLLWGTWLVTTGLVFSYMSGTVHSYYAVALAPAIAALVGAGVAELWRLRARHWLGDAALGAGFVGTAW